MRRWIRKARYGGPAEAGNVVEGILEKNGFSAELVSFRVVRHCSERLGEDFMRHMTPHSFRSGTLHCLVDSPVWNQQYSLMSESILAKLNAEPCPVPIRALRFSVGKAEENPYICDESVSLESRLAAVELGMDDKACMEKILTEVDPAFRETAGRTMELLFKYRRLRGIEEDEA